MKLLHEYVDIPPGEELHPSQMKTVGEILDLIERIQEETDEAGKRARGANVGIEFIKIAMGEIPLVGGALGAADGLFAMYAASKSDEHTWAELEEYPILARMKMHPTLAKHLDPVTLREIDKAYQDYLRGLGRKTLVSDIADIDNFTRDWIMGDTDSKLSVELLREYIREALITEYSPAHTKGKRNVWRGMKITMPSVQLASLVRKYIRTGDAPGVSSNELVRFVLGQLEGESTGGSWSLSFDVAVSFADAYGATNRGKELHVIFQATVDEESGYDPQAADEEPSMFYDEAEVRFKSGAEIPLTGIYVFIKSKDEWAKQRSQYRPLMIKAEDNPLVVKA